MKEATLPICFAQWPTVFPVRPALVVVPPADLPAVQETLSPEALEENGPLMMMALPRDWRSPGRAVADVSEIGLLFRIDLKIETGDIVQLVVRGRRRALIRSIDATGDCTRARVGILEPDAPLGEPAAALLRSWIDLRRDELQQCIDFYDRDNREPFGPLPSLDAPDGGLVDCLAQLFEPALDPGGEAHTRLLEERDPDRRALLLVQTVDARIS